LLIDRTSSLHSSVSKRLLEERDLKKQQDLEFQAALSEDIQRRREEEKRIREENEKQMKEEEDKRRKEEEDSMKREIRLARFLSLPPEPVIDGEGLKRSTGSGGDIVKLRFRFPGGNILERKFDVTNTKVEHLWYHLEGTDPDVDLVEGKHVLLTQFPKQMYKDGSLSLKECGLNTPVQIFIETV